MPRKNSTVNAIDANVRAKKQGKGRWSKEEHGHFLKGVDLHGRDWKAISNHVLTRSIVQVRTHAQKYFQKTDKGICFPEEPYLSSEDSGVTDSSGSSDCESTPARSNALANNNRNQQHKKNRNVVNRLLLPAKRTGTDIVSARLASLIPPNGVRGKQLIRPDSCDQPDYKAGKEPVRPVLRTTRGRAARGRATAVAAQAKATAAKNGTSDGKRRKLNIDDTELLADDHKSDPFGEDMSMPSSHPSVYSNTIASLGHDGAGVGWTAPNAVISSPCSSFSGGDFDDRDNEDGGWGFGICLPETSIFQNTALSSWSPAGGLASHNVVPLYNNVVGPRNNVRARRSSTLPFPRYDTQYSNAAATQQHVQQQKMAAFDLCRHQPEGATVGGWDSSASGVMVEVDSSVVTPVGGSSFSFEFLEPFLLDNNGGTETSNLQQNASANNNVDHYETFSCSGDDCAPFAGSTTMPSTISNTSRSSTPRPNPDGRLSLEGTHNRPTRDAPTLASRGSPTLSSKDALITTSAPTFFHKSGVNLSPADAFPLQPVEKVNICEDTAFGQESPVGEGVARPAGRHDYANSWPAVGTCTSGGNAVNSGGGGHGFMDAAGVGGGGIAAACPILEFETIGNVAYSVGGNTSMCQRSGDNHESGADRNTASSPSYFCYANTGHVESGAGVMAGASRSVNAAPLIGSLFPGDIESNHGNADDTSGLANEGLELSTMEEGDADLLFLCEDTFSLL